MSEIKCPKCGEIFTVDEAGYAAILQQVRTEEFQKEIQGRLKEEKKHLEEKHAAEKETEIGKAVSEKDKEISALLLEIADLKAAVSQNNKDTELAVTNAVSEVQTKYEEKLKEAADEAQQLKQKIANDERDAQKRERELEKVAGEKDKEIADLQAKIDKSDTEHELALTKAVAEVKEELNSTKAAYKATLEQKDEQINQLKDYKLKLSTKGVGEDLEQYCLNEFNQQLAPIVPHASFKKDNDTKKGGSKGDFIYRECDENGSEIFSIMFEMKNESKESKTKQKNDRFFEKLDKDRNDKGCEYAVLVTMLEQDNDWYNMGIVEIPFATYGYKKMYAIRPQFFIQFIRLLRSAALNSLQWKQKLKELEDQNIDMTHFERNFNKFRDNFSNFYNKSKENFNDAITEIENTIEHLKKVKAALMSSGENLQSANNQVEEITVRKLAKDSPTMFKALPDRSET